MNQKGHSLILALVGIFILIGLIYFGYLIYKTKTQPNICCAIPSATVNIISPTPNILSVTTPSGK